MNWLITSGEMEHGEVGDVGTFHSTSPPLFVGTGFRWRIGFLFARIFGCLC